MHGGGGKAWRTQEALARKALQAGCKQANLNDKHISLPAAAASAFSDTRHPLPHAGQTHPTPHVIPDGTRPHQPQNGPETVQRGDRRGGGALPHHGRRRGDARPSFTASSSGTSPRSTTATSATAGDDTRLIEDLGIDSLTLLEIVLSIEETLEHFHRERGTARDPHARAR